MNRKVNIGRRMSVEIYWLSYKQLKFSIRQNETALSPTRYRLISNWNFSLSKDEKCYTNKSQSKIFIFEL